MKFIGFKLLENNGRVYKCWEYEINGKLYAFDTSLFSIYKEADLISLI